LLKPELHDIEERYREALKGLQDGIFKSQQQAATSYGLSKSSLGHRKMVASLGKKLMRQINS